MVDIYTEYLSKHFENMFFQHNSNWYVGELGIESHIGVIKKAFEIRPDEESDKYLLSTYINEIWIGENPPSGNINTIEVVEVLLHSNEQQLKAHLETKHNVPPTESLHLSKKLVNLKVASKLVIENRNVGKKLDIDFIHSVHKFVGNEIITGCGTFRTIQVQPSGSVFAYLHPKKIDILLDKLVKFSNETLENISKESDENIKLKKSILLGTLFFSEFLYIHPYTNGNGRVARLLLNYLLRGKVPIPFSLYFKDRKSYMDAIESRNNRSVSPPNVLATYILLCISQTSSNIVHLEIDK